MKIAFLCKRRYMRQDVVLDRYGRLYHLPYELACLGEQIKAYCLSYRNKTEGEFHHSTPRGSLIWSSTNLRYFPWPGLLKYRTSLANHLTNDRPDIVIASSDCYHIILGYKIAKQLKIPFFGDLYDNYEAFGIGRIPLVRRQYRKALNEASGLSCVSKPLARKLSNETAVPVHVVESTITKDSFKPSDQRTARAKLDLPINDLIVGCSGALDKSRGIQTLYKAFFTLLEQFPTITLALAGRPAPDCPIPRHHKVRYLGEVPHSTIDNFYAALDIGVIAIRDTQFGQFSFPQKTYEILAMKIPLVAASVGAMKELFSSHPDILYNPESPPSLVRAIQYQIRSPTIIETPVPTWKQQAEKLQNILQTIVQP